MQSLTPEHPGHTVGPTGIEPDKDDTRSSMALLPGRVWVCGYLLVLVALWSVLGRYQGVVHDAVLYLLQAAARNMPDPLAHDLFLRFQSQDSFTVFPRLYGRIVAQFGPDNAAAGLTFLCLALWYVLAWGIARRLSGPRLALLALALFVVVPGTYGAREVFRFAEPFLTARTVAEVCCLGAMLAMLQSRRAIAAVLLVCGLAIHPLMAFPVALLMALFMLPIRSTRAWMVVGAAIVLGATVGGVFLAYPEWRIDSTWLEVTRHRSLFLFTDRWRAPDWEIQSIVLLTLALGAVALPDGIARKLMASALCVGAAGLVLAVISSQVLESRILLQGQPWRWLWISRVVATACLPLLIAMLWNRGRPSTSVAMLLAAGWLLSATGAFREVPPIGVGGLLCALACCIHLMRGHITRDSIGIVNALAIGAMLLVAVFFATVVYISLGSDFSFGRDPVWIQRLHDIIGVPGAAILVSTACWLLLIRKQYPAALLVSMGAAVVVIFGATPEACRSWTRAYYDDSSRASLAAWRALIPRDAEVFWPGMPQAAWLLLDRQSYMSISQGAGSVFSARTAVELQRRADVLSPLVPPGFWFLDAAAVEEKPRDLSPEILRSICADRELGFVVDRMELAGAIGQVEWPGPGYFLFLYDCKTFRSAAAS